MKIDQTQIEAHTRRLLAQSKTEPEGQQKLLAELRTILPRNSMIINKPNVIFTTGGAKRAFFTFALPGETPVTINAFLPPQ